MWHGARVLLVASVLACATAPTAFSAPVPAGPHASAAQVRALRGSAQGEVRRLTFSNVGGYEQGELTIELGADYVRVGHGGRDAVYDFKLRRAFGLLPSRRRFTNVSFFGDTGFRAAEFGNRMAMAKVLTGAGLEGSKVPMSVVDIQSQIGLTLPNVPLAVFDKSTDSDGTLRLRHAGAEMGSVRFGEQRFSASEQKAFARALRRGFVIHPAIVSAVAEDGRMPAAFSYLEHRGFEKKLRTLTLRTSEIIRADYPLPANFEIEPQSIGGPNAKSEGLFQLMLDAANLRAGTTPRSVDAYYSEIDTAHRQGRHLQVMMSSMELTLHHGPSAILCSAGSPPACRGVTDAMRAASVDPQVRDLMTGLSFDGRGDGRGAPYLRKVERQGLRNAYLLDVWLANDLGFAADVAPLFANGIRGNPYAAPFYKDYGDYWFRNYAAPTAWLFYDVGRSLPDAAKTPNFDRLEAVERKLTQDFPEFF